MKQTSSVSSKGQITLPIEIRKRLGIEPGDKVSFSLEEDSVRVVPAGSRLAAGYGVVPALKQPRTLEETAAIARDEHAHDAAAEGL
jgi:antitoxin PrlF